MARDYVGQRREMRQGSVLSAFARDKGLNPWLDVYDHGSIRGGCRPCAVVRARDPPSPLRNVNFALKALSTWSRFHLIRWTPASSQCPIGAHVRRCRLVRVLPVGRSCDDKRSCPLLLSYPRACGQGVEDSFSHAQRRCKSLAPFFQFHLYVLDRRGNEHEPARQHDDCNRRDAIGYANCKTALPHVVSLPRATSMLKYTWSMFYVRSTIRAHCWSLARMESGRWMLAWG